MDSEEPAFEKVQLEHHLQNSFIFTFGFFFFRISVFFVELQLRFFQRLYQRVIYEKYMYNL